jgi:hypothetical protein
MPRKRKEEERQLVHVRLGRDLYAAIVKRAEEDERSINSVIERALREHFQTRGKP